MKRKQIGRLLSLTVAVAAALTACSGGESGEQQQAEPEAKVIGTWQAEEAKLTGNVKVESSKSGFTGEGYITGLQNDGDGCLFTIEIAEAGFYDLNFVSASEGGYKENFIKVDGTDAGTIINEDTEFSDAAVRRIYLEAGTHEVEVVKSWGWISIDSLVVKEAQELGQDIYEVSRELVNKNADECAKRLFSYMCDIYGKDFLSGQYCDSGQFGHENACIWKVTDGKYPAVLGLDFIEYSPSRVAKGSSSNATEYAKEFWENGGIVTFCWHWNAPEKYLTGTWYSGFYKEHTNIDLDAIMNGQDEEGLELLISDMDVIAEQLKILREAGVPVLWRPLHEAGGGWFWWGNCEPESYIKLYQLMYDRFTNEHQLNNLIWIWNGQDGDWYPGDEYVDIIGEDIYLGERVYTSQIDRYMKALDYTDAKKMIVLSENGCLFDPDLAIRDGAMWGFFATWGGEFVSVNKNLNVYSETYTEESMLKKVYEHEHVITLDELPDLKTYPIE